MKLYSSRMKSYLLLVFGCLIFAEQIMELTAEDNSSDVSENTTLVISSTPIFSNTTTEMITTLSTNATTLIPNSTTESTTVLPSTTTVLPSTTTVLPPSVSDPSKGSWTMYIDGIACVKLDAAIQFRISYQQNNTNNVTAKLNVPINATVDNTTVTTCDTLLLKFDENAFEIKFQNVSNEISATNFTLHYLVDKKDFPDSKDTGRTLKASATNLTEFKVSSGKSYLCNIETKIDMENVVLSMQEVKVEAFRDSKDDKFSEAIECSGDEKINDIVPIAVGCALAVLVIIVLIAYLVGRQRSRQQGYQSV